MKLFAVYLGGRIKWCHVEMHDVQFSIGESIEDCYTDLQQKRCGSAQCHIDAFLELKYVDGYEISFADTPQVSDNKLYFVNAGGYDPQKFGENHAIGFYVAPSPPAATKKALAVLCAGEEKKHQDDLYDVDDCFALEKVRDKYIVFTPTHLTQDFLPMYYGYGTLDKPLSEKIIHHNY